MKKFKKAILPIALSISVIGLAGCSAGGTKYISSKAGDVTEKDIVESIGASQLSKTATSMMIQKVLLDKYKNKIDQKSIDEQLQICSLPDFRDASQFSCKAEFSEHGCPLRNGNVASCRINCHCKSAVDCTFA